MSKRAGKPATAPATIKIQVTLPADQASRLRALAGLRGVDVSRIVGEAVEPVLKGFVCRESGPKTPQDAPEGPTVRLAV